MPQFCCITDASLTNIIIASAFFPPFAIPTSASNEVTAQYIAGARAEIKAAFANLKKLSSAEQGKVQAGVLTRQLSAHSQELKDLFHRLDKNNTGKLEIHEFRVALEQICGMGTARQTEGRSAREQTSLLRERKRKNESGQSRKLEQYLRRRSFIPSHFSFSMNRIPFRGVCACCVCACADLAGLASPCLAC